VKPDKYTIEVNVDTEQPVKALDMLQARIRETEGNMRACQDTIVAMAQRTPWYKRLTAFQVATCVIVALNTALSAYHVLKWH
jgi:hypothetical protein